MLALSSLPLSLCLSHSSLRTAPTSARARPAVAILSELPPGFETLMPAVVHHTPFSRHLFNAIMGYMALDTTLFAAKIIKRRMEPSVQDATRLAAAPTTKFGWVQADLRGPLPPLEELDRLRVGRTPAASGGHTLHLCRGDEAIGYASIERSLDFTEHYGEPVYICSMEERPRLSGGEAGPEIAG